MSPELKAAWSAALVLAEKVLQDGVDLANTEMVRTTTSLGDAYWGGRRIAATLSMAQIRDLKRQVKL